jgi:hypothetical protein
LLLPMPPLLNAEELLRQQLQVFLEQQEGLGHQH